MQPVCRSRLERERQPAQLGVAFQQHERLGELADVERGESTACAGNLLIGGRVTRELERQRQGAPLGVEQPRAIRRIRFIELEVHARLELDLEHELARSGVLWKVDGSEVDARAVRSELAASPRNALELEAAGRVGLRLLGPEGLLHRT